MVGYKLAGLTGVLTAIFGTVLPPFLIISVISVFYQIFRDNFIIRELLDGMQAGVGAVIASVVWDMAAGITKKKEWTSIVILSAAFIASYVMEVPVVYIVLICIAMGVIRTVLAGRGNGRNDLSSVIFQFPSDRHVQLRRRLCRDAVNSGTGGEPSRMAGHGRIHQSDHHFPDDTGTDRSEFGNLCRNQDCRDFGSSGFHIGMYSAFMHFVTLLAWMYLKYQKMDLLQSVLQSLRPAVVAMIASAGVSILVSAFWNGADVIALADTRWTMVGIFVICLILLRKTKWTGTCDGTGRSAETADSDCGDRIKGFSFPEKLRYTGTQKT